MDEKQRLEYEKSERQLAESKARLQMLDARTEKRRAEGSAAEILGLHKLHDRLADRIQALKAADKASFDDVLAAVKRGNETFSRNVDAAGDRLDRLDDANDRWIDAESDQVFAACDLFQSWLGEEWVEDKKVAAQAQSDLRSARDDANQKREDLKRASRDKKDEARRSLQESLGRIRQKLDALAAKAKRQPAEQRT
jgi:hypothetical protein